MEKTLKDHDKSISDLKSVLEQLAKQQEQIAKQQEQMLTSLNLLAANLPNSERNDASSSSDLRNSGRLTRVVKLNFPKFSGIDAEGWIYRCEHYLCVDDTPESLKLRCAVINLEDEALQWHQSYMKTRGLTVAELPWSNYVRAVLSRFSNVMFEDAMEEIASVVQTNLLSDYCHQFNCLLNKVSITEPQAINLFLKGPVKMFKPKTLHETYSLAKIQYINNNASLLKQVTVNNNASFC